ncbi:MAG: hypothetical protein ACXU7D_06875 [Burkholderiaceae bacterium]
MLKFNWGAFCVIALYALLLSGCSPTYDWREVHGTDAPFSILLPAKPASFSRKINLDGQQVMMTMTAAEVDGVTYAVGTVTLPDREKAHSALQGMKSALVRNINGTITLEKSSDDKTAGTASVELDASGSSGANGHTQPMRLVARFIAKDRQVYQVLIVGREKAVTSEAIDTFFTSFKLK